MRSSECANGRWEWDYIFTTSRDTPGRSRLSCLACQCGEAGRNRNEFVEASAEVVRNAQDEETYFAKLHSSGPDRGSPQLFQPPPFQ